MKRILIIALIVTLLLSGCYHGEPPEPTPEMDFLKEFFTVNKDGRMDAFLEAYLQGDYQASTDAYHAGLAPYCEESALAELENAQYLYLFDKSCTDFSDQWKTMELRATYRDDQWQHQDYRVVLRYPGADSDLEITGTFDLDADRKISSFSIDMDTLPYGAGNFLTEFFRYDRLGRYTSYCAGSQDLKALKKYHRTLSLYVTEDLLSEIMDSEEMIRFDRFCREAGLTERDPFYIADSSMKNRHEYTVVMAEDGIGLVFSGTYTTDESGAVDSFTIEYPEGNEKAVMALWQLRQEYDESCHSDEERTIVQTAISQYIGDSMFYAHYADTPDQAIEMVKALIDHELGRSTAVTESNRILEMEFLNEFFTVNKAGRLDAYLESLEQSKDPQSARDTYYARLAPYVEEFALSEMQETNYLYLFDKSCVDSGVHWELIRGQASSREEDGQHHNYQVDLKSSSTAKKIEVTGTFDLDEDGMISSFTIDLETLPIDVTSIRMP